MGEHFDPHGFARGAADALLRDLAGDVGHLLEIQFAGEHHHVGPLGVELHGLTVGDVALGRDVDFDPRAVGVEDRRKVGGDDCIDPFAAGCVDQPVGVVQLLVVEDRIDREVAFDAGPFRDADDPAQVFDGEVRRRAGPHVELPDPEIDGVRSGVDRGPEGFVAPHGSHDLEIAAFHVVIFSGR